MANARTTDELLDFAHFVATKFDYGDGWTYTRDLGGIKHIRYESDTTGYGSLKNRFKRAFDWKHLTGRDSFSKMFRRRGLRDRIYGAIAWVRVSLAKDANLPDGRVTGAGILTNWEEDGEYITLFQPFVGAKVIEFLREEPDNPHAQSILAEMHRVAELSWPRHSATG